MPDMKTATERTNTMEPVMAAMTAALCTRSCEKYIMAVENEVEEISTGFLTVPSRDRTWLNSSTLPNGFSTKQPKSGWGSIPEAFVARLADAERYCNQCPKP